VEIRPLDLSDDALLLAAYDVADRADMFGREDRPRWTPTEFIGRLRSPDSGERQEAWVGCEDGSMVSFGLMYLPLLDNTEKAYVEVKVDPDRRRQGHGRAMMEHLAAIAEKAGRTEMLTETVVPVGEQHTHPHTAFLSALGFTYSNVELVRHLPLPVADSAIDAWATQAAERHEGYRLETFRDGVPDELVESLCVLLGQLAVDAPTGAVDFEEEVMTPERYAEMGEALAAMQRTSFETLAIAPDGTVAAQTTLVVPLDGPDVFQWGTFVHREHRGHRLGLAAKAANLRAVQAAFPDKQRVITQNGETNDYMVSINVLMGFELVEASAEYVRRS
jgi:GNAT superfamily N-acetyltransferase